jgi:alkylation response protein AidB-like acyl-CoA dehydrogenase
MPSIEFSTDRRDIFFTLFEQLKIQQLCELESFQELDLETFQDVLDTFAQFVTQELAPINASNDQEGCVWDDGEVRMPESTKKVYETYREMGLNGLQRSAEWGGGGFPESFWTAALEMMTGAHTSYALFAILGLGTGHLIEAFGSQELKEKYVEKLYSGEWSGTMCLTEPQAGSDVGALSTTATPIEGTDLYNIKGNKIFITYGEHDLTENIIHAVLARTPGAPAGTKGISLFVVPKFYNNADGEVVRNDVNCGRLEEKMGIHASPTCVMNFGDEGNCVGWLLGDENKGMPYMFQMMNEARLGVGVQGLGGAAAAYRSALGYAMDRKQGAHPKAGRKNAPRTPIVFHPDVRRMLMTMKAYVEGMRSLNYATGLYLDLSHHHPDAEKRAYYNDLVELMTPVCKSYSTDFGFKVSEIAVQVYGGAGYTKDYPVEQYMRDLKIASLYEGTNGIQALDLYGRKLMQKGGARFKTFASLVQEILETAAGQGLGSLVALHKDAGELLTAVTTELLLEAKDGKLDNGLLNASNYLEMLGNFACSVFLLQGAGLAKSKLEALYTENAVEGEEAQDAFRRANSEAAFLHGKVCTSSFFTHHILSKNVSLAQILRSHDTSAYEILFEDERELELPY